MWKVHIDEIRFDGLDLNLAVNREGAVNWTFRKAPAEAEPEATSDKGQPEDKQKLEMASDALVLTELTLEDISVSYRSPDIVEPLQVKLDLCSGSMAPGEPFKLSMRGVFLKEPFTAGVKNGYFDYSGRLVNIKAGIIDLWAVNLIAAILSRQDDSEINCMVGRWTLKEGVLTPDVFLIDTSRIRICGQGQVDFINDRIDLKVSSRAKKPEFFNPATPIKVKGRLSDFGIGITAGGLIGTAVKFMTSPLHVPLRRLAGEGLPADGGDVCGMPIGAGKRPVKPPPGCRNFL